jgi:hypothetical protein
MVKRKEHTRETVKSEFTCSNSSCGLVFSKPIKVKNLCMDSEVYDACPRCFTAVDETYSARVNEAQGSSRVEVIEENVARDVEGKKTEPSTSAKCTHHFGYLSQRPKNEKIPDECVMCEQIVKCMLKGVTG